MRRSSPAYRALSRLPRGEALATALSRLPSPRLTALGSGLLAVLTMLLVGGLDALLLDSPTTYGVFFLLVSAASTIWVRPADLLAAPVAAPLAFAAGLLFTSPGADGFSGTMMGLVSGLSLQAGWVYAGTLLAGLIALVRRVAYVRRRRAERQVRSAAGAPPGAPAQQTAR